MEITFHGAAQCVTGSKHILTFKNGKKLLLDCGLFQGSGKDTDKLNREWGFEPSEINYMILSHAHIDHSGLIPKLIKDGYNGPIFCTSATKDLAEVLLLDSAFIQQNDIKYTNKIREQHHLPPLKPLYSEEDAKKAIRYFKTVDYNEEVKIDDSLSFNFTDAGHIVGSAAANVCYKENGKTKYLTFTGDIGRYNNALLKSPEKFRQADIIITESTYGDRLHDDKLLTSQQLLDAIKHTCINKKGKLIIPAFSVGRTQEILFALNTLDNLGQLPNVPIFVDSPLSIEATQILKNHKECYNKKILEVMKVDKDPFGFESLEFIQDKISSQALNSRHEPMVIISASGMAEAGRVKHHIAHNISNANNTILLVGYCEPGSLGGKLMNGDDRVTIYGQQYDVTAEVQIIRSFSAHGDYEDICQFLACQNPRAVEHVFVVHGEIEAQSALQRKLIKKDFHQVAIPAMHQSFHV